MKCTKERLSLDNMDNFRCLRNQERSEDTNFVSLGAVGNLTWTPLPAAKTGKEKHLLLYSLSARPQELKQQPQSSPRYLRCSQELNTAWLNPG